MALITTKEVQARNIDQIYECQSYKWLLRVHLTLKVNVREENYAFSWQILRGLCGRHIIGLDATLGRTVPNFLLANE